VSLLDIESALGRAHLAWTSDTSHVDAEEAFHDRTLLATEVTKLRDAISGYQNRVVDLQDDVDELHREADALNREVQTMEQRVHEVLTRARWVEVEPGSYVNPDSVHWVRDSTVHDAQCTVMAGVSGLTVHRSAADVILQLAGHG
jgi:FtsZ-binding cell division protein ZapB